MAYLAALVRRGVEYRRVDDPSQRHRGIYQVLVLLDRDGHEEEVETRACREAGGGGGVGVETLSGAPVN